MQNVIYLTDSPAIANALTRLAAELGLSELISVRRHQQGEPHAPAAHAAPQRRDQQ